MDVINMISTTDQDGREVFQVENAKTYETVVPSTQGGRHRHKLPFRAKQHRRQPRHLAAE